MELPGFLSALVDVAQRGRSLGIHLLLATQRPQGVVDGKIRANTNLRIALRVQDDVDSRDVLGTRHAADIDRRRPGRGYVRFGAGEIVALQSALVSAPAVTGAAERIEVDLFDLAPGPARGQEGMAPGPASPGLTSEVRARREDDASQAPGPARAERAQEGSAGDGGPTDLQMLVGAAVAAFDQAGYDAPRVPWPAPLPDLLDAWTLDAWTTPDVGAPGGDAPPVPLGLVDLPDEQRSDLWLWRPEEGGSLVLGADPASTASVLATACLALARARHPDRQRIFILDGSGCGLTAVANLPHVAAAVGVEDGERLTRVLDWLDAELGRRRSAAGSGVSAGPGRPDGAGPPTGGAPEILLVVAGWEAVVESADRAGATDVGQRLERLLRDGGPAGIRLLISASHERGVPGRLLTQLPTKLCLRLADPAGYTGLGLRVREIPDLHGLRAIDVRTTA